MHHNDKKCLREVKNLPKEGCDIKLQVDPYESLKEACTAHIYGN
jgi:hypothetical protein